MSGRYGHYARLRDSGEQWLGDIPTDWQAERMKTLFEIRKNIAGRLGFTVLSVTQKGLKQKDLISGEGQLSMDYSKYQIVVPDDFVMNHMDLLTGYVDIASEEGVTSPDYRVFAPLSAQDMDARYYLYIFQMCYLNRIFYPLGQGSAQLGRWRLPRRAFESFVVPIPRLEEQTQIAKFLDYETAKIDALIEKQQQLIALLKEKRQAVISHAVTKGLNPDAPMRDSGVEWLGEVPAHWTATTLKHHSRVIDCKHVTAEFVDEGIPVASIGEVKGWHVDLTSAKQTTKHFYEALIGGGRRPVSGDIIYTRNATVGEAAIVDSYMPKFAMGQDVCLIRPGASLKPAFLLHCLKSPVVGNQLDLAMVGSTFKRINVDDIRNFAMTLPPSDEQNAIVGELSKKLPRYDALIGAAESTIALIQERRTALISAAVTGKIDVRKWKAPDSEPEAEVA